MEIPNSQHPGLISKSQTEEKARFTTAISKIMPVVGLIKKMYGPSRLTKLIRTDYSTYKLTQTPVVILDNIKINHPLVKLLGDYVKKLESLGDSSKFFLILVGYLVEESIKVLEKGVKATVLAEILREISDEMGEITKGLGKECDVLENLEKILDGLIKEPVARSLVLESITQTKSFSTEKIRVCKIPSGTLEDSYVVKGMVFEREAEGKIKEKERGSTAIYNTSLDIPRGELKSTIQMDTADQLSNFSKDEVEGMKRKVESLSSDVIIFSGRVNDIFLDFLDKTNKLAFKVMSKHDLRRLRELLGGTISQEFEDLEDKGTVEKISLVAEGNKKYTKFISEKSRVSTIVLKHPLEYKLDELERSINKSLLALQRNTKENKIQLCEGAGEFEKTLSTLFGTKAQESLKMYNEGEDSLEKHLVYAGLSKAFGGFEMFKKGSGLDLFTTKTKAVCYALEFVGTMYEIEDYLVGIPPKLNIRPQMNQHWDEDH